MCGHFDVIHDEGHPATKHVHSGTREGRVGDGCGRGAKLKATSSIQNVLNTLGPLVLPGTHKALNVPSLPWWLSPHKNCVTSSAQSFGVAHPKLHCPHHPYVLSGTLALTKTFSCCCRGSRTICVPLPSFFFLFLVPQGPKGKTGLLNASPTKERSPQASGIAGMKL